MAPFLIDWQASDHPTRMLPPGAELTSLHLRTPSPDELSRVLEATGSTALVHVDRASVAEIVAELHTPAGPVTLRG